jgi:hypothetical protein
MMSASARCATVLLTVALPALAASARADVWDTQVDNDNSSNTDNELVHGTQQLHDMATLPGPALDQDWYAIGQTPFSSYEIVLDSTSGDLSVSGVVLERVIQTGAPLQTSVPIGPGLAYSRSLRWANDTSTAISNEWIQVEAPFCQLTCNADDVYQIRAYETTIAVPRFNNANGQLTVLIAQNPTHYAAAGFAYLWDAAGNMVTSFPFTIPAKGASVTNLAAVNGGAANGIGGSITLTHHARYGDLNVKATAVDPATGFSFDSPGAYRTY